MLFDIQVGIAIIFLLIMAFVVGNAIYQYRKVPGTSYLTAFYNSLTMFWASFKLLVGAAIGFLATAATYLGLPEVSAWMHQYLTPQVFGGVLAFFAIITMMARSRTNG